MIYELMRRIIARGSLDAEGVLEKLDVYFAFGRITRAEYEQLAAQAGIAPAL